MFCPWKRPYQPILMQEYYENKEMQLVVTARLLPKAGKVICYTQEQLCAAVLAKRMHAPGLEIISFFDGGENSSLKSQIDYPLGRKSLLMLQEGVVDVGLTEGEQVDRFGNLNSWMSGPLKKPVEIFNGGGLACDISILANETFIVVPCGKLKDCSFISGPGYLKGGDSREKERLAGNGPKYIITDLCVFDFHPKSKRARVYALFPSVSKKEVKKAVQWRAIWPGKVAEVFAPTDEELGELRRLTRVL